MIVDTSALVKVFLAEPGYERYDHTIAAQPLLMIPMPCFVEFALLHRLGPHRIGWLEALTEAETVHIVGMDPQHRQLAVEAALTYGKGSGHPAQLNFGDCLVYAAARYRDMPLLFAGNGFTLTDIKPALTPES